MNQSLGREWSLEKLLQVYPWQQNETGGRRPLDFLWKFALLEAPAELWPFLIDTSTFNRLLGLPPMQYEEKNGRLFGRSINAGVLSEWEEVPWEWEFLKGLSNARVYSRGFASYVRTRYLLEPSGNGTNLYVYFGWVPRNLAGRLLLKLGMPRLRNDYAATLKKISQILSDKRDFESRQRALQLQARSEAIDEPARGRLQVLSQRAIDAGADADAIRRLADYLVTAPEEELARIRLKVTARRLNLPVPQLLKTFLYAAHAGVLALSWDVTCPHCRGVRKSAETLGDVPQEDNCEACDITFSTEDISNLEVVFHVNPEIRRAEKKFYCAAEPATKRHILIQRRVAPGTELALDTELEAGEYRIRTGGSKRYVPLSVGAAAERRLVLEDEAAAQKSAVHPLLVYPNRSAIGQTLVIERKDEDNDALRPAELFGLQLFRDLFGNQTLAPGLRIELGRQNILFTDIVGSTDLYLKQGDGAAFASVRKHFLKIFETVRAYNGAVVKTIGDAAMVAFSDSLQCMQAAVALQKAFSGNDETGNVLLRISIHAGPCLAVNLNSGIDYFGNTVNFAAKLQQLAGAREIAFSAEFAQDTRIGTFLAESGITSRPSSFQPPWSAAAFDVPVVRIG